MRFLKQISWLSVLRKTTGIIMLLLATVGILSATVNPLPWIVPILPLAYAGFYVDAAYVERLLVLIQSDTTVLASVGAGSFFLVVTSFILLVQSPINCLCQGDLYLTCFANQRGDWSTTKKVRIKFLILLFNRRKVPGPLQ